ncbi:MAG: hypothetical protein HC830_04870 [Bacteroidetes bacterium]|nr:hypothetical protein [Bacteroidota bacterium]
MGNKGYQNIDSLNTSNYDESKNPYLLQFRASIPVESAGNKIYISPFLNEPPSENPLKQVTRTYPVDFTYPFGRNFSSTIEIPQGYKVEFTPEPFKINNQMVSVDYQVFRSEVNKINVTGVYIFKKAVYDSEEYRNLKYIYNEIIKKFNEKVVLVKIE